MTTETTDESVEVVQTASIRPDAEPRKGYYGPDVELLLMSDGSVRWRYEDGS